MSEFITTELKSDLERVYKISGDLLNTIEAEYTRSRSDESKKLLETLRFGLMDIGGTLQKDIFNCDYIVTKLRTYEVPEHNSDPSGQH